MPIDVPDLPTGDHRGEDIDTGGILFDQVLIPVRMLPRYVGDSAQIFENAVELS